MGSNPSAALADPSVYTFGGEFTVDEDVIALDSIKCPKCGETLEFDFDEDDGEDCCCGHDHDD